ncbi:uncharacterized protein DDB_G0284459 [Diabrotica virgifera virgifera]|uniref:Uncharacterized protein n=2 Tax=Diabrotica virgifera virgifera TaxID=50390 RepID=A0ABM5K897_DIAVI|nr:uncharacterized protein DDB_G0284459 [Diabrotica virgifera virgifera]
MESTTGVDSTPQWKKDLIARLRTQNKTSFGNGSKDHHSTPHHSSAHRTVHQPILTSKSESVASDISPRSSGTDASEQPCNVSPKMVQERVWVDNKPDHFAEMVANNGYHKESDSDSSEELHYGPGIVKKLKNKYLSLALRESNHRPSILRKATSLENLLDDDEPETKHSSDKYESRFNGVSATRNVPNRYRNSNRHHEMKRARSVETISRLDSQTNNVVSNRQSLHEETLIAVQKEGSDYPYRKIPDNTDIKSENKFSQRINRPKRLQPIMSEKEKPPVDFVKQAKMIFERRPEQRTRAPPQTGDVAAKVDSFNNIIVKAKVEAKATRKPQVKAPKPAPNEKKVIAPRSPTKTVTKSEEKQQLKHLELNKVPKTDVSLLSPIPDISRIIPAETVQGKPSSNLSETPDLILTSSPLSSIPPPLFKKPEKLNNEEHHSPKRVTSPLVSPSRVKPASPLISPSYSWSPSSNMSPTQFRPTTLTYDDDSDSPGYKKVSPTSINNISKDSGTSVYNFVHKEVTQNHLPLNKNVSETKVPPSEPLRIEVNGHTDSKIDTGAKLLQTQRPRSPPKFTPPPPPVNVVPEKKIEKSLTVTEIEKNSINTAKNKSSGSDKGSVEVVNKNVVPKKLRAKEPVSNTAIFDFTKKNRDVPDYISNDKSRTPSRPELPKPGEGGIILIPGATILESFTDEDEEILRSLEGPPSPCDVTFINDNILIDGKSSLSQKTKKAKLKLSFVEDGPEVYEYPSETSMMLDDSPVLSPVQLGHTVPNLSGSSLANYTPKSTESFQPGITRSVPQMAPPSSNKVESTEMEQNFELDEIDKPFSSGHTADILF